MIRQHSNCTTEPAAARNHTKVGWRVREWSDAAGLSRAYTYNLLAAKTIASVKAGRSRIIITQPADYLASLAGSEVA
jgi:hypothetical protein